MFLKRQHAQVAQIPEDVRWVRAAQHSAIMQSLALRLDTLVLIECFPIISLSFTT